MFESREIWASRIIPAVREQGCRSCRAGRQFCFLSGCSPMRSIASRMKIVRESAGVPAAAISPRATVLDCGIYRSTPADWKWLDGETRKRGRPWSRRVRIRQSVLRAYCGKPLIHANVSVGSSVFLIFVDPRAQASVFWEERRRHPSGRTIIRCSGLGARA
jgi:hypothetical protein